MADSELKNIKSQETSQAAPPASSRIQKYGLNKFLSTLFGWKRNSGTTRQDTNLEFVKVDVGNKQKVGQALLGFDNVLSTPLSTTLENLLDRWLSDTLDKTTEIAARKARIDQLQYMVQNDPYVNRAVALYADEATQLDSQDTLIEIDTPDPRMTRDMYKLLNQWGITQTRIRSAIEQIAIYGDAFWANKVTEQGVERIIPLAQNNVTDRLEFNPVKVLEQLKRRDGSFTSFVGNNFLIDKMLSSMEETGDFADIFDTKLFGFVIEQDLVVPPWCITHFRYNGEGSDYFPWGTSPIIGALSPFKQTTNAIALQQLGQSMSFPLQLFKVKTNENMDEGRQFATVNKVRESFDNIGVNPAVGSSEVYTNNTKIWIPDGLVNVEVVPARSAGNEDGSIIDLYQSREAVALALPKSFFGAEGWWSGVSKSGKALMQQYKPLARKIYGMQSAFLEGLADLFRIHFAITGIYDFRIPFTLSLKYPAEEQDEERVNMQNASVEMAKTVVELVRAAIGAEEEEALPPDIVRDIIAKYTFLDPADIMKWTRDARYISDLGEANPSELPDEESDFSGDTSGEVTDDDLEDLDLGNSENDESVEEAVEESQQAVKQRLRERILKENFTNKREKIYFDVLQETAINGFVRNDHHVQVFNTLTACNSLYLETLEKEVGGSAGVKNNRIVETFNKMGKKKKSRVRKEKES